MSAEIQQDSPQVSVIVLPRRFDIETSFSSRNTLVNDYISGVDISVKNENYEQLVLPLDYTVNVRLESVDACNNWQEIMKTALKYAGNNKSLIQVALRSLYMVMRHRQDALLREAVGKSIIIPTLRGHGKDSSESTIVFIPKSSKQPYWEIGKKYTSLLTGAQAVIPVVTLK